MFKTNIKIIIHHIFQYNFVYYIVGTRQQIAEKTTRDDNDEILKVIILSINLRFRKHVWHG